VGGSPEKPEKGKKGQVRGAKFSDYTLRIPAERCNKGFEKITPLYSLK
jgi:hypothetical protein